MSDTQTSLTSQTGIQNNSNSLEPSNNNSLQVPTPPTTRRKRGLSLRSQLFNKAFNIQPQPSEEIQSSVPHLQSPESNNNLANETNTYPTFDHPQQNIELQNIPITPEINVYEAPDQFPTSLTSISNNDLHTNYPSHLSRSTTYLTAGSNRTSISTQSFISKERSDWKRYGSKNRFYQVLVDIKNRIFHIKDLPLLKKDV